MVRSLANSSPSVRSVAYHQPLTMCTCGRRIAIILFFPGPIIMWFPVSYRAPDTGRFLISSRDPALAFLPAASFLPSSSTSAAGLCPRRRCLRGSLLRWLSKDYIIIIFIIIRYNLNLSSVRICCFPTSLVYNHHTES